MVFINVYIGILVFEVDAILGEDGSKVINLLELIIIIYL
jgi:hypothetical protein